MDLAAREGKVEGNKGGKVWEQKTCLCFGPELNSECISY
jgi:hypothetical protein